MAGGVGRLVGALFLSGACRVQILKQHSHQIGEYEKGS
jgi:hypothetical protein